MRLSPASEQKERVPAVAHAQRQKLPKITGQKLTFPKPNEASDPLLRGCPY
jgi:hypothetical protein